MGATGRRARRSRRPPLGARAFEDHRCNDWPERGIRLIDDLEAGRYPQAAEVGAELFALTLAVAGGAPTKSEDLGHQEFILGYKTLEPPGPGCLPVEPVLRGRAA